jgi:hypothetical protein
VAPGAGVTPRPYRLPDDFDPTPGRGRRVLALAVPRVGDVLTRGEAHWLVIAVSTDEQGNTLCEGRCEGQRDRNARAGEYGEAPCRSDGNGHNGFDALVNDGTRIRSYDLKAGAAGRNESAAGSAQVGRVNSAGAFAEVIRSPRLKQLDGLAFVVQTAYIPDFGNGNIWRLSADGTLTRRAVIAGSPADISSAPRLNRLLIPLIQRGHP